MVLNRAARMATGNLSFKFRSMNSTLEEIKMGASFKEKKSEGNKGGLCALQWPKCLTVAIIPIDDIIFLNRPNNASEKRFFHEKIRKDAKRGKKMRKEVLKCILLCVYILCFVVFDWFVSKYFKRGSIVSILVTCTII